MFRAICRIRTFLLVKKTNTWCYIGQYIVYNSLLPIPHPAEDRRTHSSAEELNKTHSRFSSGFSSRSAVLEQSNGNLSLLLVDRFFS